jgi:hypothetical protein
MDKTVACVLLAIATASTSGCVSVSSPAVQTRLKTVSAGYTGCAPEANVLSNVVQNHDASGSGTWNATCNGKVYLCSSVSIRSESGPFNCALAVP